MPVGAGKGARTSNTMAEYLATLLQDVAYAQSFPDADLEYLTNLQAVVLAKIREPTEAAMAAAAGAAGAPPMGSATPVPPPDAGLGAPMGAPPMPPQGTGGAPQLPPGLRNGVAMPPVDELRRLVGGPT